MPGHKIPSHNEQDGEKKDEITLDVDFNNVSLCCLGFRDELIRISKTYRQSLKLYDGVAAQEKAKTTFTIEEIGNQFNLLEKLEKIISAPENADKNKDLRIIKEYKVILLTVLYDRIRNPNLDSGIPLPPIELPWYEKIWPGIKSAFNTLLKYLQFLALGLTKLAALFLPILALTEGIPFIASFFSIQIAVTASPILLATLTASAAIISLVSVYYYLPFLLQWLGITSPANQDKSLTQIAQEKCTIMGKINNRLEQTLLNLNSSQYKALTNIIKPINEQITHFKNNLTPHKQSLKIKIVRSALFIFNVVASAHSAIGIASLFSVATLLASIFGSASAAASFTALLPVLIPISSVVLFVGFFSWAQFLVSTTVLNALDPVGASHALLTKSLADFHPPSPETLRKIGWEKVTIEKSDKQRSDQESKVRRLHTQMKSIFQTLPPSSHPQGIDHTSITSLLNNFKPIGYELAVISREEFQKEYTTHDKTRPILIREEDGKYNLWQWTRKLWPITPLETTPVEKKELKGDWRMTLSFKTTPSEIKELKDNKATQIYISPNTPLFDILKKSYTHEVSLKSNNPAPEQKLIMSDDEYKKLKMNQHVKGGKPANDSSLNSKKPNLKTSGSKTQLR